MKFKTQTSEYEGEIDPSKGKIVLKKKKIERGQSSVVAAGREFTGNKLVITSGGCVELYNESSLVISTSPLKID